MSQQINLFNPIFLQQKKIFSALTMAQALLVLVVGVSALNLYASMRVNDLQKQANAGAARLAAKGARLAAVKLEFPPRTPSPALAAELAESERQLAALRDVSGVLSRGELGNTRGYAEYFRAFGRQHVDGLWLTGISIGGAGNEIGLRGRALDPERVPGYLTRLMREPAMRGKAFGSLRIGAGGAAAAEPAGSPAAGAPAAGSPAAGAPAAPASYVEFSLLSSGGPKP